MEKIFLDQSKYYEPINTICRKYNIPFVYDWTFSLHNNMNLLIKVVNGMVIEMWDLKEIIKEFIRMFDKDLQETIIKTLEKWQEEGKLEGIINEALFNQKLDKDEFIAYKQDQMKIDLFQNSEIERLFKSANQHIINVNDNEFHNVGNKGDQSDNINKLISLVPEYSVLFFPAGYYNIEKTVTIDKPLVIRGIAGKLPTTHNKESDYTMFITNRKDGLTVFKVKSGTKNIYIEDINIGHNNWGVDGDNGIAIEIADYDRDVSLSTYHIYLKNIFITNFKNNIVTNNAFRITYENVVSSSAHESCFLVKGKGSTLNNFYNCWALGSKGRGFDITHCSYSTLLNCAADNITKEPYVFDKFSGSVIASGCENFGGVGHQITNSDMSIINCFAHLSNRSGEKQVSYIYSVNSTVNVIGCVENDQKIEAKNSVGVSGGVVNITGSRFAKPVYSGNSLRIEGNRSSVSKPTFKGLEGTNEIVYNLNYTGTGVYAWMWVASKGQWFDIE